MFSREGKAGTLLVFTAWLVIRHGTSWLTYLFCPAAIFLFGFLFFSPRSWSVVLQERLFQSQEYILWTWLPVLNYDIGDDPLGLQLSPRKVYSPSSLSCIRNTCLKYTKQSLDSKIRSGHSIRNKKQPSLVEFCLVVYHEWACISIQANRVEMRGIEPRCTWFFFPVLHCVVTLYPCGF